LYYVTTKNFMFNLLQSYLNALPMLNDSKFYILGN